MSQFLLNVVANPLAPFLFFFCDLQDPQCCRHLFHSSTAHSTAQAGGKQGPHRPPSRAHVAVSTACPPCVHHPFPHHILPCRMMLRYHLHLEIVRIHFHWHAFIHTVESSGSLSHINLACHHLFMNQNVSPASPTLGSSMSAHEPEFMSSSPTSPHSSTSCKYLAIVVFL